MSKKRVIAVVALVGLAGIATVAAQGHRERRQHGYDRFEQGGMGFGMDHGMGRGMGHGSAPGDERGMGRRGMFGRDLTKDQFDSQTRERFARLDKNSDGVIDSIEIEAAVADGMSRRRGRFAGAAGEGLGTTPGSGFDPGANHMLRRLGVDKDGRLTRQAFLDRIKARFAEADLDNDGRITDADLPPMMRGRGMISAETIRSSRNPVFRMLRDVEVKDGAITLEAVQASATRQFDRMDRNKDGAVDRVDFEAMRKDMVDYQVKRFVHRYGADADGKVTREQFFAKAAQRFAEADLNGDGVINRTDRGGRPGFGQRMRERFMGGPDAGPGAPAQPALPPKQ